MSVTDGIEYKVRSGDSLWRIAHHAYGHGKVWPCIFAFNQLAHVKSQVHPRLRDPDKIEVGQTIYLPKKLFVPRPHQAGRKPPGRIGPTKPAVQPGRAGSNVQAGLPAAPKPAAPASSPGGGAAARPGASSGQPAAGGNALDTIVNNLGVRIDTSQHKQFKTAYVIGPFVVEVELKGKMVIQHDQATPLVTLSKDNAEIQYKREMLNAAHALTAVVKGTVDWKKRSGSVELMFQTGLIAGNKAPISLGFILDDKGPALRGKAEYTGVQGKLHNIIYFVHDNETLTLQVTVRYKPKAPNDDGPSGPFDLAPQLVGAPTPVAAPRPQPAPVPGAPPIPVPGPDLVPNRPIPVPGPDLHPDPAPTRLPPDVVPTPTPHDAQSMLQSAGKWAREHPVEAVGAAVIVTGVVIALAPEEAVAGTIAAIGRIGMWLVPRMVPAMAAGV